MSRKQRLEEIMIRLADINRMFATSRDEFLAKFELSRPQAELLFAIKQRPKTIGELAKMFTITPSAISQMVSQLEAKQLAVRRHDPHDRRIIYAELSRDTREHFTRMRRAFIGHLDTKFADLNDQELESFRRALNKITKLLGKEN